jgi:hypothetical protein
MPSHSRGLDSTRPCPHFWGWWGQVQHPNPTTDGGDKSLSPKANPGVLPPRFPSLLSPRCLPPARLGHGVHRDSEHLMVVGMSASRSAWTSMMAPDLAGP